MPCVVMRLLWINHWQLPLVTCLFKTTLDPLLRASPCHMSGWDPLDQPLRTYTCHMSGWDPFRPTIENFHASYVWMGPLWIHHWELPHVKCLVETNWIRHRELPHVVCPDETPLDPPLRTSTCHMFSWDTLIPHWDILHIASLYLRQVGYALRHWGRDKMDTIFQMSFSHAFAWMKKINFD